MAKGHQLGAKSSQPFTGARRRGTQCPEFLVIYVLEINLSKSVNLFAIIQCIGNARRLRVLFLYYIWFYSILNG